jgi:hypothetical protein
MEGRRATYAWHSIIKTELHINARPSPTSFFPHSKHPLLQLLFRFMTNDSLSAVSRPKHDNCYTPFITFSYNIRGIEQYGFYPHKLTFSLQTEHTDCGFLQGASLDFYLVQKNKSFILYPPPPKKIKLWWAGIAQSV